MRISRDRAKRCCMKVLSFIKWPAIATILALVIVLFVDIENIPPGVSFIIAVVAALAALLAANKANESVELVKATTRPFLNIATPALAAGTPDAEPAFNVVIRNTGNLPADEVSIFADVFVQEDGGGRKENLIAKLVNYSSICFPGEKIVLNHLVKALCGGLGLNEVVMRVTVEYRHKYRQGICTTVRTFSVFLVPPGGAEFKPTAGKDYWT